MFRIIRKWEQSSFCVGLGLYIYIDWDDRDFIHICKKCVWIRIEDCWKGEMWKEVWNLLVRNNLWNSRKKERKKSVIFRICQTGWNSLMIGLTEWLKLVVINQITEIQQNKTNDDFNNGRTRFSSFSASERNAVFSSFSNTSTFFEWLFREQEHLKRENGNEWKSTCCFQISSEVKWTFSIMNVVFSEIWNV